MQVLSVDLRIQSLPQGTRKLLGVPSRSASVPGNVALPHVSDASHPQQSPAPSTHHVSDSHLPGAWGVLSGREEGRKEGREGGEAGSGCRGLPSTARRVFVRRVNRWCWYQWETRANGNWPQCCGLLACSGSLPAHSGPGEDPGQFRFSRDTSLGSNLAKGVVAGSPHTTAFLNKAAGPKLAHPTGDVFQNKNLDWFPRMRAMSLVSNEGEGEQNEIRILQDKLNSTMKLVSHLTAQLNELKEQVCP